MVLPDDAIDDGGRHLTRRWCPHARSDGLTWAWLATVSAMITWLKRLFLLAVISGAAFAVWTALQRRNEIAISAPAPKTAPPTPPPPPPTPPPPATVRTAKSEPAPDVTAAATQSERWRAPVDGACPDGFPIKIAKSGIYHVPGGRSYERTTAERCYMSTEDAEADGYRRAKA